MKPSIFDDDAELYEAVRPGYPEALVDDVVALAAIPPGGRILEVACGTGQATRLFARRGYRITAVELGPHMAAVARRQVAGDVEILVGAFEDTPLPARAFDLAISATAFHWIDAARAVPQIADALRPGGGLALFWNEHVRAPDDPGFFAAIQPFYERAGLPRWTLGGPEAFPDRRPLIDASRRFGPVTVHHHPWTASYDADTYVRLLSTYSDHRRLDPRRRAELLEAIRTLMNERFGGRITKHYVTALYFARVL